MMGYQGIYINLDRSTERRTEIESELARYNLGAQYKRLSAVEGNAWNLTSPLTNANEIGCFLSHVTALKEGMKSNQHLHIIEDDTIFAACTHPTITWAIDSGMIDEYDILYTDIAIPLSNESYRTFKKLFDTNVVRNENGSISSVKFQALDLKTVEFLTTSSYLINKNSFSKLMSLYKTEITEGIRVPIDIFFRNYAKIDGLKIGCLFPFITSAKVEETLTSTVRKKPDTNHKFTAANIGRYSFFVGCDWNECERLMQTYIKQPSTDDHHAQVLVKLLAFSLTVDEKTTP